MILKLQLSLLALCFLAGDVGGGPSYGGGGGGGNKIPVGTQCRLEKHSGRGGGGGGGNCFQEQECGQVCDDCRADAETEDHSDKRENLGDCFLQADNDAGNLLLGFLKEFGGSGFNLG